MVLVGAVVMDAGRAEGTAEGILQQEGDPTMHTMSQHRTLRTLGSFQL